MGEAADAVCTYTVSQSARCSKRATLKRARVQDLSDSERALMTLPPCWPVEPTTTTSGALESLVTVMFVDGAAGLSRKVL